jgi:hypothetical protein
MSSHNPTAGGSQAPSASQSHQVKAEYFTGIDLVSWKSKTNYDAQVNLRFEKDNVTIDLETTVVVDDPAGTTFSLADCNDLKANGTTDQGYILFRKPPGPGESGRSTCAVMWPTGQQGGPEVHDGDTNTAGGTVTTEGGGVTK